MAIIGSGGRRQVRPGARGTGGWRRIAVLLEPGASGTAALERGVALAREHEAELIVVAVAPQAEPSRCAAPSPEGYNDAVCQAVRAELEAAKARAGAAFRYVVLVEHRDEPLGRWLDAQAVDLVLLPRRWPSLGRPRHPAARRLRRSLSAEIRVIAP
ncbi:MAG TPA: universal stress protein [Solirubrobacteraceae bacterium]|jgi:hypothetical protein